MLDGAVIIVDAVSGVQAQTQTVWKQIRRRQVPAVAFINKMDRDGASMERAVDSLRRKLGANVVPIQLPIGSEEAFNGIVDVIARRKITWDGSSSDSDSSSSSSSSKKFSSGSLSVCPLELGDTLYEQAAAVRRRLVEALADADEQFMELYMGADCDAEADALTVQVLLDALRRVVVRGELVPALCGASLRGKGVEPLLDSIVTFLPSPLDRPETAAVHVKSGETKLISPSSKDLCAMAFKVTYDAARGPLVFCRVFSGKVNGKQALFNSTKRSKERVNQLLRVSADDLDTLAECGPGGVCCIVGLKHTVTGDTLVAESSPLRSYVLEGLSIPPPVFALAIEPERSSQQKDLDTALQILCVEDPSLSVEANAESGQTLLRGIGELHLEIVCDKLRRQFQLDVLTGRAYVAYRESLDPAGGPIERDFTYDRLVGAKQLYAALSFEVTPTGTLEDPTFSIPKQVQAQLTADEFNSLHDGLLDALRRGPRGYPIVGLDVAVCDVRKNADTTPGALRACAAMFVSDILRAEEQRVLLEPMMTVEVELPPQYVGDVLSDLSVERRAHIKDVGTDAISASGAGAGVDGDAATGRLQIITAEVPLASMLGYASTLRSKTQGEGSFSSEYCTHVPVDPALALL